MAKLWFVSLSDRVVNDAGSGGEKSRSRITQRLRNFRSQALYGI
jgi:Fe-S cluster assembly ATPase SufC